jgi:uncharacterized protein (TIGR00251 family)
VLDIIETTEGIIFNIRVLPRSSRSGVAGIRNGALKIKITAPALEGRANEACIAFLADLFGVPRKSVSILGGLKSKNKRVFVAGLTRAAMEPMTGKL